MANKQTRSYKKAGYSRKVIKGASSDIGKLNGGLAVDQAFEKFEGRPCITAFKRKDSNPMNKRKSPWKGMRNNSVAAKLLAVE